MGQSFQSFQVSTELNTWQGELAALSGSSGTTTLDSTLQEGASHLSAIKTLLLTASQALTEQTSLSATTLNTYKTAVTAALSEVNIAATNVDALTQNIASQKISIQQL